MTQQTTKPHVIPSPLSLSSLRSLCRVFRFPANSNYFNSCLNLKKARSSVGFRIVDWQAGHCVTVAEPNITHFGWRHHRWEVLGVCIVFGVAGRVCWWTNTQNHRSPVLRPPLMCQIRHCRCRHRCLSSAAPCVHSKSVDQPVVQGRFYFKHWILCGNVRKMSFSADRWQNFQKQQGI